MTRDMTTMTRKQVAAEGLADWVWLVGAIEARYETGGFATGLDFVNRIGAAAEEADHHPDLTLTWPLVQARLLSHDAGGVTSRDIAMARRISENSARSVATIKRLINFGTQADLGVGRRLELEYNRFGAANNDEDADRRARLDRLRSRG